MKIGSENLFASRKTVSEWSKKRATRTCWRGVGSQPRRWCISFTLNFPSSAAFHASSDRNRSHAWARLVFLFPKASDVKNIARLLCLINETIARPRNWISSSPPFNNLSEYQNAINLRSLPFFVFNCRWCIYDQTSKRKQKKFSRATRDWLFAFLFISPRSEIKNLCGFGFICPRASELQSKCGKDKSLDCQRFLIKYFVALYCCHLREFYACKLMRFWVDFVLDAIPKSATFSPFRSLQLG